MFCKSLQSLTRRDLFVVPFHANCILAATMSLSSSLLAQPLAQSNGPAPWDDRVYGMLLGSLIGDAMGGPVEFKSADELRDVLPDLRNCDANAFRDLLKQKDRLPGFTLFSYHELRPSIAPYGPWEEKADPGTVTDDSRHKMILMHCLRRQAANNPQDPIAVKDLCRAYLDYFEQDRWSASYRKLANESFREYQQAARWQLGERQLDLALPPERIWAGIANCSGQMALLPLAALYPERPDDAYRATYALGFLDTGQAKDINASMVAALARAIAADHHHVADRWRAAIRAMRETDPYRYGDVPFAKRPTIEWLDFAIRTAEEANGSPAKLYETLEKHGRPKYYWDAHFTFATTWAFLHFADYDPKVAMLVSLAFGHDTDSTAQLVGALCGAIHGKNIFPKKSVDQVEMRLRVDYQESFAEWLDLLRKFRGDSAISPVKFVEESEPDE